MTLNQLLKEKQMPVTLYDTFAKRDRTFVEHDPALGLWRADTTWFLGTDTAFEARNVDAKCMCDIVTLMRGGCKCNGI